MAQVDAAPETVLVVGAGAHKPYGFPLGRELMGHIVRHLSPRAGGELGAVVRTIMGPAFSFDNLADALRHTHHPTIDEFVADASPDIARACRAAIAATLLAHERDYSVSMKRPDDDWIGLLNEGPGAVSTGKTNKLAVVTFNYDRLLEYSLLGNLKSRAILEAGVAPLAPITLPFPVLHVYGSLLPMRDTADLTPHFDTVAIDADTVGRAAESLLMIGDAEADQAAGRARSWIQEATRVVFFGFGFHDTNLRMLGLSPGGARAFLSGVDRRWDATCVGLPVERRDELVADLSPFTRFGFTDSTCRRLLEDRLALSRPKVTGPRSRG